MSLWWSEHVRVAIGSNRVEAVRMASGWRARVLAAYDADCVTTDAQPPRHEVMHALELALEKVAVKDRPVACHVVAGNKWVRYQLASWQDGLSGEQERASYMQMQMQAVYGALSEQWQIACSEDCYGYPTLISAMDREFLASVQSVVLQSGLRLASVKPYLSRALLRWRRGLPRGNYWFALIEGERICLLNSMAGKARLLRMEQVRGRVGADLLAMLRRESMEMGQEGETLPVYAFCPEVARESLAELNERKLRVLDAATYLAPLRCDLRYAMALV